MPITVTSEVKCNELTEITTPDSSHGLVLFNDSSNAGVKINYQALAEAILNRLTEKKYQVNSAERTLIEAIETVQGNIAIEKQSVEDKLSPTALGSYGSLWDNNTTLLDISSDRNNALHLVYAENGTALSDRPSIFDNYNNTIIMYRREHSVLRTGEDVTEAIVTLTEILPVNGREWIATYRNETWSDWIPSSRKFIQAGATNSIAVTHGAILEQAVNFPVAFPSVPEVTVGIKTGSTGVGMGNVSAVLAYGSTTTTGFTVRIYNNDTVNRSPAITWIAVG